MSIARINSTYLRRSLLLAYAPVYTTLVVVLIILEGVLLAIRDLIVPEAKDAWRIFASAWEGPHAAP